MEENEREIIRTRLTKLTQHTRCTPEFLIFFFERKILTFDEIQEIAGIKVDSERASKFYMLIRTRTDAFAVLKEGLEKYKQTGALNVLEGREDLVSEPTLEEVHSRMANLSSEPTTVSSQKRNISFDVFPPVISFIGRTKELKQLHKMVLRSQGAKRIAGVSQVTSVSGLGGIGKTQLAREYVRINGKEFDGNVLWMNAESEQSLYNSFKKCAEKKLRLQTKYETGKEISVEDLVEAVFNYFEGWKALFVLDNAEKGDWFKTFMPKVSPTAKLFILITSRDREWDRGMEVLQLDELTEDEAVKLMQQGLDIDENDSVHMEDIKKLAQTLQCFPLALQQAIAYIYEQQITSAFTIKSYLDEFERKQQQLLTYIEEDQVCDPIFTTTTATTWSITFDKIKDDLDSGWLASLILNVVAYLGSDNIKRNLFYPINQSNQFASVNEEQINKAVRLLVKYSMLNGRENQSNLNVHRLVQSVTRNKLAREEMDEYYLEVALLLLQGYDRYDFPSENIGHALIAWRHAFARNQIIENCAWQVYQILWKMREAGHHSEGIRLGNVALEACKAVLGDDNQDVLLIHRGIGLFWEQQTCFYKAVPIFQYVHSKAKSVFGEDSKLSMLTKEDLGTSLQQIGKYKEAQHILREVLEKKKIIYGENHESTLITEEKYGMTLLEEGKLAEGDEILQRLLKIYVKREGIKSANVFRLQHNFSKIYSKKGSFEKALEICRDVYEKLTPVWAEDVDLFAGVILNLGNFLIQVEKFEEALEILEGNIEKIKKRLGNIHLKTLGIQKTIGRAYQGLENYSRALEIFQDIYQGQLSLFGEDSLDSLLASRDIAITLFLLRHHAHALSMLREIIPKLEDIFGKDDSDVMSTKPSFYSESKSSGANFPTGMDFQISAWRSIILILNVDSKYAGTLSNHIKVIKETLSDFDKASSTLQNFLPRAKSFFGSDSQLFLEIKGNSGNTLIRNGKYKEAQTILGEVLEKRKILLGEDHSLTLATKLSYGMALMEDGNLDKAEDIFQKISKFYFERGDENNKTMLRSRICLDLISSRKEVVDNNI